ncbi:MAG: YncE family protein, partial [Dehalococcoidia bacterium]|nr:YncE family protein [Dehalococcoidia bacterium]
YVVGDGPVAAAFDGVNVWVANFTADTMTKLRASDGAVLGTYAVGVSPSGVAYDGVSVWVTNQTDATVTKL